DGNSFKPVARTTTNDDGTSTSTIPSVVTAEEKIQKKIRSRTQDEGQAGSDPSKLDEGQVGPNPDDVAESQPLPTPSVLAGPNLEHSDVEITDASSQPQPEHMDEGFTATAYPNVQENLKLTTNEQVIPEEPASSTGTLSSLQQLGKDFSFGDQFFNDKPSDAENEKTTADTEVESMVSISIQQDTSVIPPMTSPVIGLVPDTILPNVHGLLQPPQPQTSANNKTLPLPPLNTTSHCPDPITFKCMGELEELIANLVEENQALEERLDKQGSRINKLETMDLPKMIREQTVEFIDSQEIDRKINESVKEVVISSVKHAMRAPLRARFKVSLVCHEGKFCSTMTPSRDECEDFDVDKAQEETKKKSKQDSPKTLPGSPPSPPPPPPPPSGASGASGTTRASDSAQAPPPPPLSSSTHQGGQSTSTAAPSSSKTAASAEYSAWTTTDTRIKPSITTIPDDLYMDDETTADEQAYSSGEEVYYHSNLIFCFNKDLEYLRYGRKIGRPALSISKMKAAFYPDVGLEQLVPDQFWIEEECKYDIAAMYGISHWWFQRQRFYIDRFSSEGDRRAVRTHMRILSVVRIEVFSMYGYDYMKKIILRRADLKEYVIAERDFKYMYPSDFEDLYLLNLQGHLNHLSLDDKKVLTTAVNLWTRNLVIRQRVEDFQLGIESYQTQLNLTKPRWDATGFEFKHDYTVIDSPRAVTFREIDEALDYRVKEFRVNRTNPGMNTRFWTKKDVVRSKEFMFAIQKRLKTRRIFQNLESFVGGRIREGDYRLLSDRMTWSYKDGKVRYSFPRSRQNRRDLPRDNPLVSVEVLRNPVKEIPLKRNLPDHRSILTDSEDPSKMEDEIPRSLMGILHPMLTLKVSKVNEGDKLLVNLERLSFKVSDLEKELLLIRKEIERAYSSCKKTKMEKEQLTVLARNEDEYQENIRLQQL
ncbi:hypothetical protein Tco_0173598, partial [Tanacetum coccineum]